VQGELLDRDVYAGLVCRLAAELNGVTKHVELVREVLAAVHEEARRGQTRGDRGLRVRPLCYNPERSSIARQGGRMELVPRSRIYDEENPHYADDDEEKDEQEKDDEEEESAADDEDLEDDVPDEDDEDEEFDDEEDDDESDDEEED
jgi:hypothetical protein